MKTAKAGARETKEVKELVERLKELHSSYNNNGSGGFQFALAAIQAGLNRAFNADAQAIDYLLRLARELFDEAQHGFSKVDELLLVINFNYRPYFLFLQERIRQLIAAEETVSGKLEALAFELKRINQVQEESGLAYSDSYPSIKEVMSSWIHEEMSYLQTRRLLAGSPQKDDNDRKDFRIAMDLSVAQLACLVHSLVESKVILNKNLSELAVFFAATTITKKSENISEGSFRRKYYNIEDGTRRSVADVLNRVVDWLIKK